MSSDHRDIYVIRGDASDADDEEGWLVPEPADEVIVDEILDATALSRDDVEPLSDYVEYEQLHELLAGDGPDDLTFAMEDVEVTVTADGSVTVSD